MVKSRSEKPAPDELQELQRAVERLSQQIEVLTDVVDRLHDELQWRNNERQNGRDLSSLPVLRNMPADPTTEDWQINRVSPQQTAELREHLSGTRPTPALPLPAHDQLCREIAELRQIVAAFVLITAGHELDDLSTQYDSLLEWASLEFDPELLRESLPAGVIADTTPALSPSPSRSAVQPTLFAQGAVAGESPASEPFDS